MTVPVSVQEHIRSLAMGGVSERKIARVTGLSRNTVSKYVNRVDYSPKPCKRVPRSKVDAFSQVVVSWLLQDEDMPVKQRHSAKRVYDRLVAEHGFTGSYSSVSRWVKRWRVKHRESCEGFSELVWEPGVGFVPVVWETRLADKVGNILVGDNRYQVGSEHAGKRLQVGIGDLDVTILDADGSHIACHKRVYPKQASTVTTPVKLLDGLIKRPGSWRESLLRGELPPVIVGVLDEMWNQGDKPGFRQFLRIIRTVSAETDYSQTIDTTQRLIMAGRDITLDALLMATKRQAHPDETQSNVVDLSVYDSS